MKPAELKINDTIIERDGTGRVTRKIQVHHLGYCPVTRKGIPDVHVNHTLCFSGITNLEVSRG